MLELVLVSELKNSLTSSGGENIGVMDMASALKSKVRGLCTARKENHSLWVYRPNDTYALGWITYADLMDNGDGNDRYSVFSPNILNGKYSFGNREHMSSALSMSKAVKNAERYLRPLNLEQVIRQVHRDFRTKLSEVSSSMGANLVALSSPLRTGFFSTSTYKDVPPNALQLELKHLLQTDYVFIDKELEETLHKTFAEKDEWEESKGLLDTDHMFIEAYQSVGGSQFFRGYNKVARYGASQDLTQHFCYDQEELPEHIKGAISVLSMVDVGQYVVGVGYRASGNMFYIKSGS